MEMHYRPCDMCGKRMRCQTHTETPRCHECRAVESRDKRKSGRKVPAGPTRTHVRYCECGKRIRCQLHIERPRCHVCRRAGSQVECPMCGGPKVAQSAICKACRAKAQRVRADDDHRVTRQKRESAAPGIPRRKRDALLVKWRNRGALCTYCDNPATTVDHVVPLVRGGTNYEGNLAPACKHCNSSKGGLTVIEWRTGKRLPQMVKPVTHKRKPKPVKVKPLGKPVQLEMFDGVCELCGAPRMVGLRGGKKRRYCSQACQLEANARRNRDAYRARVGLPVDPTVPTKPRARAA